MKLTPIAVALLLAPLAMTAQAEVTFTPFAAYQWFDTDTVEANSFVTPNIQADIEAKEGYALALGYRFTKAIGVEVNYGRTDADTETDAILFPASAEVRNSRLSLDGYYAFNADSTFSPYVLLGVGQTRLKSATAAVIEDTMVNGAVGAFWRFNENVALRMEARNVHNIDASLDDQIALLGLEFSPGATTSQADEPAPQPVVEEAPAPVEELAAAVATVIDSDGDGVADTLDKCAETPAGMSVDANGCPLDTDKDGVPDSWDKCPETAAGVAVDATGCYEILKQEVAIEMNVQFATGKADIQGDASAEIQKVADFMAKFATVNVTIEGHTDSRGNAAKNKALSQKRADAVKAELVKLGVDAARLTAVGYGAEKPVADNATEAGRAQNRRVVAAAKAQAETIKMKK